MTFRLVVSDLSMTSSPKQTPTASGTHTPNPLLGRVEILFVSECAIHLRGLVPERAALYSMPSGCIAVGKTNCSSFNGPEVPTHQHMYVRKSTCTPGPFHSPAVQIEEDHLVLGRTLLHLQAVQTRKGHRLLIPTPQTHRGVGGGSLTWGGASITGAYIYIYIRWLL